jgi:hypothetical protein
MTDEVDLVDCVSCGALNHPARTLCGRCRERMVVVPPASAGAAVASPGAEAEDDATDETIVTSGGLPIVHEDQDTPAQGVYARADRGRGAGSGAARVVELLRGTAPGDTQPLEPMVAPPPVQTRPVRARPVVLVTLAGLALGAVVGVGGALWLGRSASDQPVALSTFNADLYPGLAGPVDVASVEASSFLAPTGENTYEAALLLDSEVGTAWNSDGTVRPDGIGERLEVKLDGPAWITDLEFANGYQKDDVRFLANARIARATLTFDGGVRVNVVLLDQNGFQRVPLPGPVLTTSFTIEVLETFPGDTYKDLAVSELRIFGHEALGEDRELGEAQS